MNLISNILSATVFSMPIALYALSHDSELVEPVEVHDIVMLKCNTENNTLCEITITPTFRVQLVCERDPYAYDGEKDNVYRITE